MAHAKNTLQPKQKDALISKINNSNNDKETKPGK